MKGAPFDFVLCQSGAAFGFLASCHVASSKGLAALVLLTLCAGWWTYLPCRPGPGIRYLECIANVFHSRPWYYYYSTVSHLIDYFQTFLYILTVQAREVASSPSLLRLLHLWSLPVPPLHRDLIHLLASPTYPSGHPQQGIEWCNVVCKGQS